MLSCAPSHLPGYELFFAPLEVEFDPTELERVQFAYTVSKHAHASQVRDDGSRYFDHPKATSWIYIDELGGRDPELIIILLLHDISEDSYLLTPYRISLNFGKERALDLRAMTKLPGEKKKESTKVYLGRVVARGPRTILAKLCDRLHNVRTLNSVSEARRADTLEETKEFHIPILINALREFGEKWKEMADLMEQKLNDAISEY